MSQHLIEQHDDSDKHAHYFELFTNDLKKKRFKKVFLE